MKHHIRTFEPLQRIRVFKSQAEEHLKKIESNTSMEFSSRMNNIKLIKEKITAYNEVIEICEFLFLQSSIGQEFLRKIFEESMANNGTLSFGTTRKLKEIKTTLEEEFNEMMKTHD